MVTNLLSVWGRIGSIALAILILLMMITIHEFGHYVAGKILRFKINEFSVGFGPALFKHKSKKSGEVFSVRLIPLGGYCAFEDESGLEEEREKEEELLKEPVFEEEVPLKEETPTEEDKEVPSSGEAPEEPSGRFIDKKPWQRIIVLVAGALMNYLLALVLILIMFSCYGQSFVKVRGMQEDETVAAGYSLEAGDILLKANGKTLYLTTDLAGALNKKKAGDTVELVVLRKDENGKTRRVTQSVILRADVKVKNSSQVSVVWKALGIGIETREGGKYYMLETASCRLGFFETIGGSFVYSFKMAGSIFKILGELLTGQLGISAIGGPVTTVTMTAEIASQGLRNFLEISGYIGVNLAVFNLLPIPALDGSKVVFTAIEWIRGKPISRKVEAIIHAIGFVLLFGFAILVDILQFVL